MRAPSGPTVREAAPGTATTAPHPTQLKRAAPRTGPVLPTLPDAHVSINNNGPGASAAGRQLLPAPIPLRRAGLTRTGAALVAGERERKAGQMGHPGQVPQTTEKPDQNLSAWSIQMVL